MSVFNSRLCQFLIIYILSIFAFCLSLYACVTTKGIDVSNYLVKNDINAARSNSYELERICSESAMLNLKGGVYYIDFEHAAIIPENVNLEFYNGTLVFQSGKGFFLSEGCSFKSKDVIFRTKPETKLLLLGIVSDNINIEEIAFDDCAFKGNVMTRIKFNPTENKIGGINRFYIRNCTGDFYEEDKNTIMGNFWIENGGYFEECEIANNRIKNMVGPFIYLSDRNPLLNQFEASVSVHDNDFSGAKGVSINSYHCATLIETMKCMFYNNAIYGFVNANTGNGATAYDSYLSCNELYYDNNVIENICAISDTLGKRGYCEWGKSKEVRDTSRFSCRVFRNNRFNNDPVRLRTYGVNDPIDYKVSIFNFATSFDSLIVDNNHYVFNEGCIAFPHTTKHIRSVQNIMICNNEFTAQTCTGSLIYGNTDQRQTKSIRILKNYFNIQDRIVSLSSFSENRGYGCKKMIIEGNISSTGFAFSAFNTDYFSFKNNISYADEKAPWPTYYNFEYCKSFNIQINKCYNTDTQVSPDIFYGMTGNGGIKYHVNNIKSLPYIQFRVPFEANNYSLALKYRSNEGNIEESSISEYSTKTNGLELRHINIPAKGDFVTQRLDNETNPFLLAKKGIGSSLKFDSNSQQSIIQISGYHSTWPELDFDASYGIDLMFEIKE